ncbi:MAG: hypothetical protein ACE5HP_10845, partial [Gemmatimonadota bacterium]
WEGHRMDLDWALFTLYPPEEPGPGEGLEPTDGGQGSERPDRDSSPGPGGSPDSSAYGSPARSLYSSLG